MVHLITPHYQRKRFFRPKQRGKVWRAVRRYQLVELIVLTGGIALVWLGAHLDNQAKPWTQLILGNQVESASAELIDGVPVGTRQRRPL
ncbi:MAG: hypothetical protein ACRECX_14020 [Methyloceanibacter sp.]|uniref:hypothetical protein n=1 Tax=Methyloceanibacter sp. TaxID=1965321 RepID=UPI003D6CEA3B